MSKFKGSAFFNLFESYNKTVQRGFMADVFRMARKQEVMMN